MADLKYYDVIIRPLVTEKSMSEMSDKKYAFYVHPDATKIQIKQAIEKMFDGVKVERVNTMNVKGKLKRRGRTSGYTAERKKALVKLTEASKEIVLFQGM
ncbi:MAG: 50S ribosomal protein L23 [Defluviitaleaceae bacterium]|nr:50S ribosomal protein L23 [Defluviitaleaceae bacterium]